MGATKRCTKCGEVKLLECFGQRSPSEATRRSQCKPCGAAAARYYRKLNPERVKAIDAAYRASHPERVKANDAAYRFRNPEKMTLKSATRYANDPEKAKARVAEWQARNPHRVKANYTACRSRDPQRFKDRSNRNTAELSRAYVRGLLARQHETTIDRIPDEFVEIKRQCLITKRNDSAINNHAKKGKKL